MLSGHQSFSATGRIRVSAEDDLDRVKPQAKVDFDRGGVEPTYSRDLVLDRVG
jgi:hypothetical protein